MDTVNSTASRHRPDGLSPAEAARWTRIGALAALALLLGYLESFVPIPIPGVKLGLANIPVLVALSQRDLRGAFFVSLIKVLATGLLFGNPVTLAYSATGTLLAFALMAPLSLLPTMRLWMVSVVGALAHEAGQLLVAQLLLGTPLVWYGAPLLAVASCVTGLLCGIAAMRAAKLLQGASMTGAYQNPQQAPKAPAMGAATLGQGSRREMATLVPTGLYVLLVVLVMHARGIVQALACLAVTLLGCKMARVHVRELRLALAPTLPLAVVTLIAQLACNQRGAALAVLGPLVITHEALRATALMLMRLVCISCASVALVRLLGRERLVAAVRQFLRPLEALGFATQGPKLALATAFGLIALLADELPRSLDRHALLTRRFWTDELPAITRQLYERASGS